MKKTYFGVIICGLITLVHSQLANINRRGTPTIEPYPNFDAMKDAEALRASVKGFGTSDRKLIGIVTGRSNAQRQAIRAAYRDRFKRDAIKDIEGDTSGSYRKILVALMTPEADYDASLVRKAVKGLGTDFNLLIEVVLTRSPERMNQIREAYKRLYKRDMISDIKGDTNRKVKDLLVKISEGRRDESNAVNVAASRKDAQILAKGTGNFLFGFDSKAFTDILATRNFAQLNLIFDQYSRISKRTIEEGIRRGTVGKYQKTLLTLVEIVRNPGTYFARRIRKAVRVSHHLLPYSTNGLGTSDSALIRIFTTQPEIDMGDIKVEYQKLYKKTLESAIRGDVSGNFQRVLVSLIRGNRSPLRKRFAKYLNIAF